MDKSEFIRIAPAYYELAVILALRDERGYIPTFRINGKYFERHPDSSDPDDGVSLVENEDLLNFAIDSLVEKQAIEILSDPFGPSQCREGEKLGAYMERARADRTSPLFKAEASGDADAWIRRALEKLNTVGQELNISAEDWANPDKEWEPIPLDRESPAVKSAIEAVDETIRQVEQSNGYASQHPEERKYVLGNLKALSETLKTAATTSIAYIKNHGIAVLGKLQTRFVDALIGESAKESAKALWNLIKEAVKSAL